MVFPVVMAACGSTTSTPVDGAASVDGAVDAATSDVSGGARAELATGGSVWTNLPTDGSGRAEIVHGPQGGYHIFGRVRFEALPPDVYVLFRVTRLSDGRVLTDDADRLRRADGRGLVPSNGAWESASGELVILQVTDPATVANARVRFEVTVTDVVGARVATDQRTVTLVDDEP